ncbi:DUF1553 domain-containing protein [bacterium]|nr:DUF1553 domain-containing protein [bacterium]
MNKQFHTMNFVACLIALCLLGHTLAAQDQIEAVDFEKKIQPIFQKHCSECHGPETQESSLRVDRKSSLLLGGDWGEPAIVPSAAEKSFLYRVVSGLEPDLKMPPEGPGLSQAELSLIKQWIESGAIFPASMSNDDVRPQTDHWSFQSVQRPKTLNGTNALDQLLEKRLIEKGLSFSPQAERHVLIRRLYLVMLGLPPTPEQVQKFVNDKHEDAWQRLVDSVLASPQYGERFARQWLDLIRFGETHGFETNRERPHAWRYRDWVIQSFNNDKPYDQFIKEQIAGDALGEPIGTGYLVAGPHDIVKSPDINLTLMQRQDELSDLINATGTSLMGLTLGCARCHNHKFDPITQKDFYAIQAVFAGVNHADRALPMPLEQQQQLADVDKRIASLRERLQAFSPTQPTKGTFPPVTAKHNVEQFPATEARFVRFTISKTNGGQPGIDELEIFAEGKNVALSKNGAKATSSSNLPGYEIHKLEHINDGQFGNPHSWISNEPGAGWVQIEFAEIHKIDRIEWARDRDGRFGDRVAIEYQISSSLDGTDWKVIASDENRQPFGSKKNTEPVYVFDDAEPELAKQGKAFLEELKTLQAQRNSLAQPVQAYAGTFSQPGPTHRLYRGDPMAKKEEVAPDAISIMGSLNLERDTPEQQRRLKFAEFVADAENPFTSRVIVNRLWQFHFGTGIVATSSDFGKNGAAPTHPELLDWLAAELVENQWSLKHIHRQILLSKSWQQTSLPNEKGLAIDASARLLWRYPPRRLDAEWIRDCILSVSEVIDLRMGGPGFSGFEVDLENVRHFHPKTSYGPEDFRRMIYMTKVRQEQDSVFGVFDCPDASQVVPQRSRSTTPLQALSLMNSEFIMQQAKFFSERLQKDAMSPNEQIKLAFRLCFNREPTSQEMSASSTFVNSEGIPLFCRALLNANEFLFVQ